MAGGRVTCTRGKVMTLDGDGFSSCFLDVCDVMDEVYGCLSLGK